MFAHFEESLNTVYTIFNRITACKITLGMWTVIQVQFTGLRNSEFLPTIQTCTESLPKDSSAMPVPILVHTINSYCNHSPICSITSVNYLR